MPVFYLETSALLKRYRTEQGSEVIGELVSLRRPDDLFVTSYFTTLEVEATAARALKARLLNRRAYGILLGQFAQDLGEVVLPQSITNYTVRQATELARRYALRGSDSLHVATAVLIRQSLAADVPTVMVTSDGEILLAAREEGFEALNPQDPEALRQLQRLRS